MPDPDAPDASGPQEPAGVEPDPAGAPQPRVAPAHRSKRPPPTTPAPVEPRREPTVDIHPPHWFAIVAVVAAAVFALLGVVATVGSIANGDPIGVLLSFVCGAGLAVMAYDASTRRATSHGDELEVHQWFRVVTLRREELEEFAPARASFVRWDIVAVPREGVMTRLWVTRMLPAGRVQRQDWLAQLEAWRTWIGPTTAR